MPWVYSYVLQEMEQLLKLPAAAAAMAAEAAAARPEQAAALAAAQAVAHAADESTLVQQADSEWTASGESPDSGCCARQHACEGLAPR